MPQNKIHVATENTPSYIMISFTSPRHGTGALRTLPSHDSLCPRNFESIWSESGINNGSIRLVLLSRPLMVGTARKMKYSPAQQAEV